MEISVEWDNQEQSLMRWTFPTHWTWQDYDTAQRTANGMLKTVPHKVGIIGDMRATVLLPRNAIAVYHSTLAKLPANRGRIVLVGPSGFVREMVAIFRKLYPRKSYDFLFVFANTLEEAREILLPIYSQTISWDLT